MADFFDFIKNSPPNATPNGAPPPGPTQQTNPPSVNGQTKSNGQPPSRPQPSPTQNLDLMTHLTQRSNRAMMAAQTKAKELKGDFVDSEHLLYGLTTDSEIYNLFVELKIQPQVVQDELGKIYKRGTVDRPLQVSPRIGVNSDRTAAMESAVRTSALARADTSEATLITK